MHSLQHFVYIMAGNVVNIKICSSFKSHRDLIGNQNIVHSWVEVYINDQWYAPEGVIIDKKHLSKLQKNNKEYKSIFCGFGVYTNNFENLPIDWDFNDVGSISKCNFMGKKDFFGQRKIQNLKKKIIFA